MLPALIGLPLRWWCCLPQPALAASGGRIGGGSFRSAPMPRSYGGGGGYQRGYGGGGIGFPFIVPFFFGGGGLFGFLVLMAVVGLVLNAFRGGGGGGQALPAGVRGGDLAGYRPDGPVSIAQLQVGLLATARDLQRDLRSLASSSDTSTRAVCSGCCRTAPWPCCAIPTSGCMPTPKWVRCHSRRRNPRSIAFR